MINVLLIYDTSLTYNTSRTYDNTSLTYDNTFMYIYITLHTCVAKEYKTFYVTPVFYSPDVSVGSYSCIARLQGLRKRMSLVYRSLGMLIFSVLFFLNWQLATQANIIPPRVVSCLLRIVEPQSWASIPYPCSRSSSQPLDILSVSGNLKCFLRGLETPV